MNKGLVVQVISANRKNCNGIYSHLLVTDIAFVMKGRLYV